jgi:carbon storage regulator
MSTTNTSKLVLSRRIGESIIIGEGDSAVTVHVVGFQSNQVKLSFEAPRSVSIDREEIRKRKTQSVC